MNSLYFIALIPPDPLKKEIQELKLEVKERFQSSHSLNAPPHITLLSPFRLAEEQEAPMYALLQELAAGTEPFEVRLRHFSTFPPRVIFIDVVLSEALQELQSRIEAMARSHEQLFRYHYAPRPYHPHITLAFKDLTKRNFYRAWKEFEERKFEGRFLAGRLYVLKHDGTQWREIKAFDLGA